MQETPTYQVISRKYRPKKFATVCGQEAIVTTLKNALRFKRVAHAYLFCGSRGTGKTTLARLFAKALNCHHLSDDLEPCGTCPSCLEIAAGRSLDVLEIDGASNRGIDDIRQITETIGYAPASGKYKIYIIDEVHMLTKEAFNALLKTLEEPPANVKFFFATTEPHKVLPTIVSRCQRFDLGRIPLEKIREKLFGIVRDLGAKAEEEALHLIAHRAEGSLRDAESLLDQILCYSEGPLTKESVAATLGLVPSTTFLALDEAIREKRLPFAFELTTHLFSSGKDLAYFIEGLMEHYRLLLLLKIKGASELPRYLNEEERAKYQASASHYTEEHALYILDYLTEWSQQIAKTPFKRLTVEMILLHLLRSQGRLSIDRFMQRLSDLEGKLGLPPEEKKMPAPQPQPQPKIEEKRVEEKAEVKEIKETKVVPIRETPALPAANKSRHETLMRFAAIELEGSLHKE